jgi:hypothetical protein
MHGRSCSRKESWAGTGAVGEGDRARDLQFGHDMLLTTIRRRSARDGAAALLGRLVFGVGNVGSACTARLYVLAAAYGDAVNGTSAADLEEEVGRGIAIRSASAGTR